MKNYCGGVAGTSFMTKELRAPMSHTEKCGMRLQDANCCVEERKLHTRNTSNDECFWCFTFKRMDFFGSQHILVIVIVILFSQNVKYYAYNARCRYISLGLLSEPLGTFFNLEDAFCYP